MGLRFEAFFILKSKGGGLKEISCRPCEKVVCPAHKERRNDNLFCCQTQGTFQKRAQLSMAKAASLPML
jgi:hypothetical protein